MLGIESTVEVIDLPSLLWQETIELTVEHADDLATLVVHNGFLFPVPQQGNGVSSFVFGIRFEIQLLHKGESIQRVSSLREGPSVWSQVWLRSHHLNDGLQSFEGANDVRPVSPGTAIVHVEHIATLLRREIRRLGTRNEGAEVRVLPTEMTITVRMLVDLCLCDPSG